MSNVQKAIIPAAGLGKRMSPVTEYLPKAMLPFGKKPVLQHIINEINRAGIKEILLVIRSEHKMVRDYFEGIDGIRFAVDDSADGPGAAVLKGESFINKEPFVVAFVDAPFVGDNVEQPLVGLTDLMKDKGVAGAISIYPVPADQASSRGIVKLEKEPKQGASPKLVDIVEKPEVVSDTKQWASACRYLATPELFSALKKAEPDEKGELQLTAGIKVILDEKKVFKGQPLSENVSRFDTGNFSGYFEAACEIGKRIGAGN